MNNNGNVVIGFGNSTGRLSKSLLKQQFHLIERINIKPSVSVSKIRVKQIPQIDIGIFRTLISKRRNQILLQSFIGINQVENEENTLYKIRSEARNEIKNIQEELQLLVNLQGDSKNNQFMVQTHASQAQTQEYLREFDGNVKKAISVFKERQAIINRFATKNQMNSANAKEILKANHYNQKIFE